MVVVGAVVVGVGGGWWEGVVVSVVWVVGF